jgi:hypothetical protein
VKGRRDERIIGDRITIRMQAAKGVLIAVFAMFVCTRCRYGTAGLECCLAEMEERQTV